MNFIPSRGVAHFYDEDSVEIGKLKIAAEKIYSGAELSLWKHLVEIGELEGEEEPVEAVFERLNRELGIEEFCDEREKKRSKIEDIQTLKSKSARPLNLKPKIPSVVARDELSVLYDVLLTRDPPHKKTKVWLDGLLKYHPNLKLAEFYDAQGNLVCKKIMESVKEGQIVEGGGGMGFILEIISLRKDDNHSTKTKTSLDTTSNSLGTKTRISSNQSSTIDASSIITYAILYTTDKHKKSKKWLDGRCEYNCSTKLARFITEDSSCFYKKVLSGDLNAGDEFESGIYLFQIDGIICGNVSNEVKMSSENKRDAAVSIVEDENVPLNGQSNSVLLSILRSKTSSLKKPEQQQQEPEQ